LGKKSSTEGVQAGARAQPGLGLPGTVLCTALPGSHQDLEQLRVCTGNNERRQPSPLLPSEKEIITESCQKLKFSACPVF